MHGMDREELYNAYPWMQDLTDDQTYRLWQTYDRVYDHKGCAPWSPGCPITTIEEVIDLMGSLLEDNVDPGQMEHLEDELQLEEEFKLADWLRNLRHERESEEEERERYEREDNEAERLAQRRRRRRPRN
jgi:hypothetical protein